jgi:hypothetical protein
MTCLMEARVGRADVQLMEEGYEVAFRISRHLREMGDCE